MKILNQIFWAQINRHLVKKQDKEDKKMKTDGVKLKVDSLLIALCKSRFVLLLRGDANADEVFSIIRTNSS